MGYSEADDPKTEKGIASYGSTFQLPKTDTVFIITFGDYMMPNDGMVYVRFTYYPLSLLGRALGCFSGGLDVAEGLVIKTK